MVQEFLLTSLVLHCSFLRLRACTIQGILPISLLCFQAEALYAREGLVNKYLRRKLHLLRMSSGLFEPRLSTELSLSRLISSSTSSISLLSLKKFQYSLFFTISIYFLSILVRATWTWWSVCFLTLNAFFCIFIFCLDR